MKKARAQTIVFVFLFALSIYMPGCTDKFLDPTQIGRFRPVPAVNVILDSLGVADETPSVWEGAEEPRPVDAMTYETDYTFSPGDNVRISIYELLGEGASFENDYVVTETGKISIPEVGVVEAAGLTESQLEEEIKQILSPSVLKKPSVTAILVNSQQRTFSISGNGIPQPGRYNIPRTDFRLLDALAIAGGISQFNISYVYVARTVTGKEAMTEPAETTVVEPQKVEQQVEPQREMLEIIAPRAQRQTSQNKLVVTSSEMVTDRELSDAALPEGFESSNGAKQVETKGANTSGESAQRANRETIEEPISDQESRIEWIFQDGKWVPVQLGQPRPIGKTPVEAEAKKESKPLGKEVPEGFGMDQMGEGGVQMRVIKIDADALRGGDPRHNIVIRPSDNIQVPVDIIGEFCIMGNVNAQGYVNLTGRPMTLKMAIAAAGGLGPLAWPKRCEVIRRIGKKKEEVVLVDLDKIASGEQPDFFIKPNDTINVGTHPTARWRAVLRNAFRATYGFGFIYDRNFADRDFGTSRPIPGWF